MKYLLDTGAWLRAVHRAHTIPTRVLRVLQAPRETFGLAAISIWEVGKKVQIGKLSLPKDLPGWCGDALAPTRVVRLPISNHYVFLSNEAAVLREMRASLARFR